MFKAMPDYNHYLTGQYGNYLKLPPKKKRKAHKIEVKIKLDEYDGELRETLEYYILKKDVEEKNLERLAKKKEEEARLLQEEQCLTDAQNNLNAVSKTSQILTDAAAVFTLFPTLCTDSFDINTRADNELKHLHFNGPVIIAPLSVDSLRFLGNSPIDAVVDSHTEDNESTEDILDEIDGI